MNANGSVIPQVPGRSHKSIDRARWWRLIPLAVLVYVIVFMDRTNISYAFSGLAVDFGIDKAQQGLAGQVC